MLTAVPALHRNEFTKPSQPSCLASPWSGRMRNLARCWSRMITSSFCAGLRQLW